MENKLTEIELANRTLNSPFKFNALRVVANMTNLNDLEEIFDEFQYSAQNPDMFELFYQFLKLNFKKIGYNLYLDILDYFNIYNLSFDEENFKIYMGEENNEYVINKVNDFIKEMNKWI